MSAPVRFEHGPDHYQEAPLYLISAAAPDCQFPEF
jgi:hypothetical protein